MSEWTSAPTPLREGDQVTDDLVARARRLADGPARRSFSDYQNLQYVMHKLCDEVEWLRRRFLEKEAEVDDKSALGRAIAEGWRDRCQAAEQMAARLAEALREAKVEIHDWGQYASDYFKEKWDLDAACRVGDEALTAYDEWVEGTAR